MYRFKTAPDRGATVRPELGPIIRSPQRVTATLNWHLHQRLVERATYEGRSVSNLMAHLLETAMGSGPD